MVVHVCNPSTHSPRRWGYPEYGAITRFTMPLSLKQSAGGHKARPRSHSSHPRHRTPQPKGRRLPLSSARSAAGGQPSPCTSPPSQYLSAPTPPSSKAINTCPQSRAQDPTLTRVYLGLVQSCACKSELHNEISRCPCILALKISLMFRTGKSRETNKASDLDQHLATSSAHKPQKGKVQH